MQIKLFAAGAALTMLVAQGASGATLVHAYEFNGTTVTDLAGTANGTLGNGASVSGGALRLDGVNDLVTFDQKLIDTTADFSVFLRFSNDFPQNKSVSEIISQGFSGQPGFYIGAIDGRLRLTDNYSAGTIALPMAGTGYHNLLVTSTATQSNVYLDGQTAVFTGLSLFAPINAGDFTRLGTQFGSFNEYYGGNLDTVRIFGGIATYAEASVADTSGAVPEPATWAMMVAGFGAIGGAMRRRKARVTFV